MLPPENQRVLEIINCYFGGNQLKFSNTISVSHPRINRLFRIDERTAKYPLPSFDIIQKIVKTFTIINPEWILIGEGEMEKKSPAAVEIAAPPIRQVDNNIIGDIQRLQEEVLKKDDELKKKEEDIKFYKETIAHLQDTVKNQREDIKHQRVIIQQQQELLTKQQEAMAASAPPLKILEKIGAQMQGLNEKMGFLLTKGVGDKKPQAES